jgi:hypothetical protein
MIMSTKAEIAASNASKKGPSPTRLKKQAQQKPRTGAETAVETSAQRKRHRVKRDAPGLIAAERETSSPAARASREKAGSERVRGSA